MKKSGRFYIKRTIILDIKDALIYDVVVKSLFVRPDKEGITGIILPHAEITTETRGRQR